MNIEKLEILWQDTHFVAIQKPAGIHVHRSGFARHEDNCTRILRDQLGSWIYPIHRLDRATSGVLLFGLDQEATRRMSRQFAERAVKKTYLAVVRGYSPESGIVDRPLKESPDKAAAEAVTAFRTIAKVELPVAVSKFPTTRYSLAEVSPQTGRRHQIRRHLAGISHPILVDTLYGDGKHNRFFREKYAIPGLMLYATKLSFIHPFNEQEINIETGWPEPLIRLADAFGWPQYVHDSYST